MTTTGTDATSRRDDLLGAATRPYQGERSAFAYQLDLYYRLAVRMVLAGSETVEFIQQSRNRRQRLETVLMVPHALWLNDGDTAIDIGRISSSAVRWLASALSLPGTSQSVRAAVPRAFGELAMLLANTDAYYARLDELDWADRYRPVGKTFQQQAPLITTTAGSWRFNYDRNGRTLTAELESEKVPYGGPDWVRNAAFIREVVSALKEFAGQ